MFDKYLLIAWNVGLLFSYQEAPKQNKFQITESPSGNQFPRNGSVALVEITGGDWGLVR